MENFKYSINNISSQIFHIKKINSELKGLLEESKKCWKELKSTPNGLPNDLKHVVDNLFMIAFKDSAVKDKHINKFTYMLKALNPEDKAKIRDIKQIGVEVQRLNDKDTVIAKAVLTIIKEFKVVFYKELERRSKE
ncbi:MULTISPECIES: hypothetical protein [Clostridium]|uniref:Uncharacterized protein n=2 Tax=Clostridium TaxID=1485 RepID=D8GK16_CLOLD|nr:MULTISPECIES: hypothetical protein [Clostridium]ADK13134.1 hypothetical protein CLJU_c00270 [Clostridium ljungdahlii DSM 13528]AGY76357.1 hypothetical protein CAETHG_2144 [Clostridium autoethanogenum DSM 10061]ALU36520.1 Hypothetical protein CLAU_2091 [Clostridium autoethanogenum DSM 10061]OAA84372.1 hypothetical protein WX45_01035 [Clostridium ljungdahlii DSM 13528]OVY48606.1 hypothetical protein WX72_00427 [Clostridium autoethanogenum]